MKFYNQTQVKNRYIWLSSGLSVAVVIVSLFVAYNLYTENKTSQAWLLLITIAAYVSLYLAGLYRAAGIQQQLWENNQYLSQVINQSTSGIIICDLQLRILDANQTLLNALHYPQHELANKSLCDICVDNHDGIKAQITNCQPSGKHPESIDCTLCNRHGEHRNARVKVSCVKQQNYKFYIITFNILDSAEERQKNTFDDQKILAQAQSIAQFGSWHWNLVKNSVTWSDAAIEIYQLTRKDLKDSFNNLVRFVHPKDRDLVVDAIQNTVVLKEEFKITYRLLQNGQVRYIEEIGKANTDANGQVIAILGTVRDVTKSRELNEQLAMSESVFSQAQDGIFVTDKEQKIQRVNAAFCRITGYKANMAIGQTPRELMVNCTNNPELEHPFWQHLDKYSDWSGERWEYKANGEPFLAEQYFSKVCNDEGNIVHYLGILSDITKQHELREIMRQKAYYDNLTNLPNRTLFLDRLKVKLNESKRKGTCFALCFLDLDGFKQINDKHGHDMGDQVLIVTAARMAKNIRESDTVSRLAGDEFTLILDDVANQEVVMQMAEKLISVVNQPIEHQDQEVKVGASFGVVIVDNKSSDNLDTLLKQADHAMYQAKSAGKNQAKLFDSFQIN